MCEVENDQNFEYLAQVFICNNVRLGICLAVYRDQTYVILQTNSTHDNHNLVNHLQLWILMLGLLFCGRFTRLLTKLEKRNLVVLCFVPANYCVLDFGDALLATFL